MVLRRPTFWLYSACSLVVATVAICLFGCNRTAVKEPSGTATSPARPAVQARVDAQQHFDAGKRLVDDRQYDPAVSEFTAALQDVRAMGEPAGDNELLADIYCQRGLAFLGLGFPDTAAEDFTAAIHLQPEHRVAYGGRGQANLQLGFLQQAVDDCTESIRLDPTDASAYRTRGLAYLGSGKPNRTVADLEHAVVLDKSLNEAVSPQLAQAYLRWSDGLAANGEEAMAADKLERARQLQPDIVSQMPRQPQPHTVAKPPLEEADEHYHRGREFLEAQSYHQALEEFTQAIGDRHGYRDAYLWRGETWLAMGSPESALRDVDEFLRLGAPSADAYRLQARAYAQRGDYYRTIMAATEALYLDPTSAESYAVRGAAFVGQREWDRGMTDLEEAVRRDAAMKEKVEAALSKAKAGRQRAAGPH